MKINLIPLGLVIPAVVLAQPMPPALPEGMTQNQIRLMQSTKSYAAASKDSKSLRSDTCNNTCQKAYEENFKACEEAGGTSQACYLALHGG
jgi:hypothetical protein